MTEGGGVTSIYRGHGDMPLIKVYFLESFSQTGYIFWKLFAIFSQAGCTLWKFPSNTRHTFDFLTRKPFVFDIILSQNNETCKTIELPLFWNNIINLYSKTGYKSLKIFFQTGWEFQNFRGRPPSNLVASNPPPPPRHDGLMIAIQCIEYLSMYL